MSPNEFGDATESAQHLRALAAMVGACSARLVRG